MEQDEDGGIFGQVTGAKWHPLLHFLPCGWCACPTGWDPYSGIQVRGPAVVYVWASGGYYRGVTCYPA